MKLISYLAIFLICINIVDYTFCGDFSEGSLPYAYQTPLWRKIFHKIRDQRDLLPFSYISSAVTDKKLDVLCASCNVAIGALLMERSFDMTNLQMAAEIQFFCTLFEIEDDRVCDGAISLNMDSLGYIIDNQKNLNSNKICNLLRVCNGTDHDFNWSVDIPKGSTTTKVESKGNEHFTVAHLTDIHYDPSYTEGKVLECGEPLCCQEDQDDAPAGNASCGYWTSIKDADSSLRLVNAVIDEINKQTPDYIYFTGDLVAHRVWDTSVDYNSKTISDIMDLFYEKFIETSKVPVYPILGNHETHPVNVYAPLNITDESLTSQWLFDLVSEKWSKWLGDDVIETVRKGGYYTVTPRKGFRVIVLNNNVCQTENWWNLYDDYDPYGQLQWLAATLKDAEYNREIVHILTHIPNSHCLNVWGRVYNKIIERFANTIAAQFNGHTHRDQFHIFYNSNKEPMNVVFNGGSLMPDYANPNYKIYTVDSEGYDVMDAELYTFDLEKANANGNKTIEWYRLYSFRERFGVAKLTPIELDTLVNTMYKDMGVNDTLIKRYHNYYYRNSKRGQEDCDEEVKRNYLCEILTTVFGQTSKCQK